MQATEKVRDGSFGSWSTPEIGLTIEYPFEVMEEIRTAVCDGHQRLAHGGLEVGGVLFGTRRDTSIRLLTWRPIFCEHALGPSLRLSTRDRAELARLLEVAKSDPDLRGLNSLGWFVSHTRSNLSLSTADVEIYDNFFPALWQVTLILQPTDAGPTRAGFFGRETDGSLRMESSYLEFEVEPLKFLKETSQRELVKPSLAKGAIPSEPSSSFGSEAKLEPSSISERKRLPIQVRPTVRERWIWETALSLALVIIGLLLKDRYLSPPDHSSFPFRVYDAGDSVRVEWDSNSALIRSARLAVLDIKDGNEKKRFALSDEQLHDGNMKYVRKSDDLEMRMSVFPGKQAGIQQFVRLVNPQAASSVKLQAKEETSPPKAALDSIRPPAEPDQLDDQVKQLKEELGKQSVRANRLQEVVRILQNRIAIEAARTSALPPRRE
jgi:proteasome lid subunit RPN8/RPN11